METTLEVLAAAFIGIGGVLLAASLVVMVREVLKNNVYWAPVVMMGAAVAFVLAAATQAALDVNYKFTLTAAVVWLVMACLWLAVASRRSRRNHDGPS